MLKYSLKAGAVNLEAAQEIAIYSPVILEKYSLSFTEVTVWADP